MSSGQGDAHPANMLMGLLVHPPAARCADPQNEDHQAGTAVAVVRESVEMWSQCRADSPIVSRLRIQFSRGSFLLSPLPLPFCYQKVGKLGKVGKNP